MENPAIDEAVHESLTLFFLDRLFEIVKIVYLEDLFSRVICSCVHRIELVGMVIPEFLSEVNFRPESEEHVVVNFINSPVSLLYIRFPSEMNTYNSGVSIVIACVEGASGDLVSRYHPDFRNCQSICERVSLVVELLQCTGQVTVLYEVFCLNSRVLF